MRRAITISSSTAPTRPSTASCRSPSRSKAPSSSIPGTRRLTARPCHRTPESRSDSIRVNPSSSAPSPTRKSKASHGPPHRRTRMPSPSTARGKSSSSTAAPPFPRLRTTSKPAHGPPCQTPRTSPAALATPPPSSCRHRPPLAGSISAKSPTPPAFPSTARPSEFPGARPTSSTSPLPSSLAKTCWKSKSPTSPPTASPTSTAARCRGSNSTRSTS